MASTATFQPISGPLSVTVRPPGSKSLTNRALVCAALSNGTSVLTGALDSDDTRVMIDSLNQLGIDVTVSEDHKTLTVEGASGTIPSLEADLHIGNSGTTVRFLTAMTTLGRGAFRLDGVPRMRERPLGDLADALNTLGSQVTCESPGRCPPVMIHANGLKGGSASVRGNISSQFLSGILMATPCAESPTELVVDGELVSKPYVEMTLRVMEDFGVVVEAPEDLSKFSISSKGAYQATEYSIEPDASAASYYWAAAAILGGTVTVEGLSANSLQGDVNFVKCLETMGCDVSWGDNSISVTGHGQLRGADLDMNPISDTVQTLAAVALFAEGTTTVTGVAHNRHKETDRIGDLATELRKLGAEVEELPDGLRITPGELCEAHIDTYEDHRMAMSLSLVGLRQAGVVINDPGCTAKTYATYFQEMSEATGAELSLS